MKKDLTIHLKIEENGTTIAYSVSASIPEEEKDISLALFTALELGIPATDWEIENRAKSYGFDSTEDMLKQSNLILSKTVKLNKGSKGLWTQYRISEIFGKQVLLDD